MDHFHFRLSVFNGLVLVAEWEAKGCSSYDPGVSPTKMLTTKKTRVRVHLKHGLFDSTRKERYSAQDKHVNYMENIPAKEGSPPGTVRQLLCIHFRTSKTVYWCKKCIAPLCMKACYIKFHTSEEEKTK
jgi:hypothetical protein